MVGHQFEICLKIRNIDGHTKVSFFHHFIRRISINFIIFLKLTISLEFLLSKFVFVSSTNPTFVSNRCNSSTHLILPCSWGFPFLRLLWDHYHTSPFYFDWRTSSWKPINNQPSPLLSSHGIAAPKVANRNIAMMIHWHS